MTNKSILDNWEEEFERMINKREEDMKNSKLDITMGDLIDFISSLLQAQREKDAEMTEKVIRLSNEGKEHGLNFDLHNALLDVTKAKILN